MSPAVSQEVGFGTVTAAPTNLRSTVTGSTVRLDWDPIVEPITRFQIEAGSALARQSRSADNCRVVFLPEASLRTATLVALPSVPTSQLAARSCAEAATLRSLAGTTTTSIQFVNTASVPVRVYWLDYEGRRVLHQTLGPSEQYVQATYVTHPWLITDTSDNCRAVFLPESSQRTATIR